MTNATNYAASYRLQDIVTEGNIVPPNFPRTKDVFVALTGEPLDSKMFGLSLTAACSDHDVRAMLTAYGLPVAGNPSARKSRLGAFLGIQT